MSRVVVVAENRGHQKPEHGNPQHPTLDTCPWTLDTPSMDHPIVANPTESVASWKAVSAIDRRVVGVLVEKAKTTPDQYPLTVNALRNGSNQKSNRYPLMQLEVEDVEESWWNRLRRKRKGTL